MRRNLLLSIICFFLIFNAEAQDAPKLWTRAFQAGLNFNQAAFSDNWKGGGVNSVATGTFLNFKASYNNLKKITWDNDLQLAYGSVQNKGENLKKMADKIFFDSKLGYKIAPKWNLFASTNFLSQFDAGFEYSKDSAGAEHELLISRFLAPGYFTHSLGLEYKPVSYFWMRFGTGTLRQTVVTDKDLFHNVPKNYGVDTGKTLKNEIAFQFIANYDKDILPNTNFKLRLMGLAPYEDLGRIVSRLDAILTAKVNKYISVNLSGTAINDLDQDSDVQFSQIFGLGIMYSFSEFK